MKNQGGTGSRVNTLSRGYQSHLVALEQRMMFDAAAVVAAAETLSGDVARDQASDAVSGDKWIARSADADQPPPIRDARDASDRESAGNTPDTQTDDDAEDVMALALDDPEAAGKSFIFIDTSMPDYRALADLWADRGTVVLIDHNADGIDQMRLALAGHDNIDSIHIVSHGQTGGFMLGTTWIDANTAQGTLKASLESIGAKLTADGDILLYGCNIGADAQGRALLDTLAAITGADIAASDDDTGAASRGGDWVLEARSGHVQTLALDGGEWDALMAQIVINPTGGVLADGSDGLRIFVTTTGQLQVAYQNALQLFSPGVTVEGVGLYNGMYMAVGTSVVGPDTNAEPMTKVAWSVVSQSISGDGSTANPFIVTTQLYYNVAGAGYQAATDYLATVQVAYVSGARYFTNTITVTPPATNTQTIKWYHAADTYLGGSDNGPAYALATGIGSTTNVNDNISVIATRRGFGTADEVFVGFAEIAGGREFDRFYSGTYNGAGLYTSGIANGGDIVNTINTDPSTDNGLGVQFTLGAINTPTTFSYYMLFDGDTHIDLDANDSSATGNNYVTSFGVGSNTPVSVVDDDIAISNIVADISSATVTITNAQAGDTLSVIGTLPSGITASVVGNVLTLTGSASEAAYQEALKLVHFNTSSMAMVNRSLTIAVYNEISSDAATATSTINVARPPVVDLNSGTTAQQIVTNGNFSSMTGWTTAGASGGHVLIGTNGAYRWSTDFASGTLTQTGITGWDVGSAPSGAAQLSFGFGWGNGVPDNSAAATLQVSVGGVVYAEIVTGTTAGSPNTATITYLNGASGSPATVGPTSYGAPVFQTVTINLPSTVPATGDLVFSYASPSGRDDIVIDNVSVLTQVDAVSGNNYTATYTENGAFVPIAAPTATVRDTDSANIVSARIVLTNAQAGDLLNINTLPAGITGTVDTSVPGQITVLLTGTATKAAYANALRAVTFGSSSDNPSATPRTIEVTVNDGALDSAVATTTINVIPVNDAPVNTIPATAQSTPEDTPLIFSAATGNALRINDVDNTTVTVIIAVEKGTFRFSTTSGLTFNNDTMDDWATISVTGTVAAINAALEGASFRPTADNGGEGRITITTTDGALSDTDSFVIDITPVNDAVNDSVNTNLNTPITFNPLANDAYSGIAHITALGTPAHGSVVRNADGTVTYTPGANYVGGDSFTYTAATVDRGFFYEYFTYNALPTSTDTFASVFPSGFPTTPAATGWTPDISQWDSYDIATEVGDTDNYLTIRWTGQFLVLTGGTYTFNLQADNVARLIIDGSVVQTNGYGTPNATVTITLSAGVHNFQLLFGDAGGNEIVDLRYSGADTGGVMTNVNQSTFWGSAVRYETATVSVTVVDQPPVLTVPGAQTVAEDATLAIGGVSITDVDSSSVTATLNVSGGTASVATDGGAAISGNGTTSITITGSVAQVNAALAGLSFTGTADYNGAAQITLSVNDGRTIDSETIAITVTPVVDITNDTITTAEDTPISFNVLTGTNGATADSFENSGRVVTAVTQPPAGQGVVTFLANGTISYTPPANYNGTTSFTYTVASGGVTETATVTINVTAVNDAPVNTLPATATVTEDVLTPITGVSVSDVDSGTLTVTLAVLNGVLSPSVSAGSVSGSGTSTLTVSGTAAQVNSVLASLRYRSNADYNGADTLTMTTSDGVANDVDTLAITVTPVADITNDSIVTNEDTPISFNVLTGTGGATADNFEDAGRAVTAVTQPPAGEGSVNFAANGTITYTPPANFSGTTSFTYTVTAGGVTETATVTVTVIEQNDAPVTIGASNLTSLDGQTIDLPLGSAFSDVDGDTLSFSATGLPPGLSINPATGVISGTIDNSASQIGGGVYAVTVTANDGRGGTVSTSFTWTITNPGPIAVNDSATVNEDNAVTILVLANDSDPDGDPLTVVEASAGNGTVMINPNGTITYVPNANFNGSDTIIYTIDDGEGGLSTAAVTVTINAVNDAPTTIGLPAQNDADGESISVPVASAFSDVDGDTLTYSAAGLPPGLSIDPATGVISGTLPSDASLSGPYNVTITAVDPSGQTATATFVWTVQNVPPLANDDVTITAEDTAVTVIVLANDSDPDGDPIRIYSASATHGTVTINGDNSLTFTPDADFHGVAHVTYTITDDEGGYSTATLTITVTAVNDAPVSEVIPDAQNDDGQTISIDVGDFFSDIDGDTLSFSATGLPAGLSIDPGTGLISGTIAPDASQGGASGVYTVTITATDPDGLTSTRSFSWTISNPAPTAVNDLVNTAEDTPITFNPLANDSDPDGDPLTIIAVDATDGVAVINGDGTITFTPNADFAGTATVTYTISDSNGGTSSATIRINVIGENDIPVAVPDSAVTNEDAPVTIPVLANDSDADGDPLTVVSATAENGTVTINSNGTITYTPNPNFNGTDTITYVIEDGQGGTATATVSVTVNPVNDAPVAGNDTAITNEDEPLVISPLVNDSDVDNDPLTITAATAGNGTVVINGDGTITYTPDANFNGSDTISYTVSDGNGGTATATITVTVNPVNDAPTPVGTAPARTGVDGATVSVPMAGYFSDVDNATLTYSATGLPPGLSIDPATGMISGTIDRSASQTDGGVYSVVITATDADGLAGTQGFSWTITNPVPIAANDSTTTAEDTPVTISVLANDSDPDGDPLTITAASAANGSVVINGDGTITYTPNANFNGTDTISYTVSDGQGGIATATVAVTITTVNDTPVSSGLPARSGSDNAVVAGVSVTAAFSDVDGDTLSYSASGLPAGLTLNPTTGIISGTIAPDASTGGPASNGVYEVIITATDPNGASVSTTFVWSIGNPAPIAANDSAMTTEDSTVTINVLGNDNDPDGDPLTVSAASAANGTVIINGDGTITYTPNANFNGTDTITYTVSDGQGGFDTAIVTVTVAPVNDAPTPIGTLPARSTPEGTSVTVQTATHFTDIDSTTLSYSATGLPPGLTIDTATGVISGTIDNTAAGVTGSDSFTVVITATDPGGLSATQQFTWTVTNPGPTAANDVASTDEDTPVIIDVVSNDTDPDNDTLVITGAIAGNGSVIINGDGTLTYTPNANFNGTDTITYTVTDGQGGSSTATVTVTVDSVNDDPVTSGLPSRIDANSELVSVPIAPAFSDVDGDTLNFSATGLPDGVSIDPVTGVISGTIASNASTGGPGNDGNYIVTVTASDGNGGSVSTSFTWTINNVPPVAVDDSFTVDEDSVTDLDVVNNDIDPDGNPLPANPITAVSATNGTATVNPDGTIRFTPDPDFNGIATITYTIQDSDGDLSSASVTISVNPVNDAPTVPIPLSPQTGSDGQTITPVSLANFFVDVDADALTFSATGLPNGLSIDPTTGVVSGTINPAASTIGGGIYTVEITADDGNGGTITTYFIWTVGNPAPTAVDDAETTAEDTPITIDVLANDTDPDGDTLMVSDASATNGTVDINGDGTITYTPNANFNGTDTITYTIDDGQGGTSTATVTVTVTPVNDAPTPSGMLGARSGADGATVSVPTAHSFTDIDNASLSYDATKLPAGLTIDPATGVISGTIDSTASQVNGGVYTVIVTATDAGGLSATQQFTWTISNPAPTADDDSAMTSEDTPVIIDVLANDADPDSDPLVITSAQASNGSVVINGDGTITYTPNANFNGTDTINYTIDDGNGGTAIATVTVTVAAVNDAPVANDDVATTNEDAPVTIPVLDNDSDVDGNPLTITGVSAANGNVVINGDGTITYTPDPDFSGTDTINYTIDDGNGGTATATVTVTVNPVNDAPVAGGDSATTNEETPVTIPVLANDGDVDGDPLTITDASAINGTVTINADGTITYVPDPDFNGTDTITYTIDDGNGGTATATVTVTVNPVNDAPIAGEDTADTDEDSPVTIPVLANDDDVDGDPLTVIDASAGNGNVVINGDGTITYTPNPDFNGTDTISYTIDDGNGGTATATITVTVNPVNDAPIANDDTATVGEDGNVTIPALANDSDIDGDPLTITDASATNGTVTINPDGTIDYRPNPDFHGSDTISYTVDDGNGGTVIATVTVTVVPINDAPIARDDSVSTDEDTPLTIAPLNNDSDVDGDPLTITHATASNGTVTINGDGTISYVPDADFNGTDTISYTVNDGNGGTATATITVTVNVVNDTPVAANDIVTSPEDGPVTIPVLDNDSDVDGDPLTIIDASATNGTVTISPDGTITYTPNPDFNGTDTISYTIDDGNGGTSTAIVNITVTPINDAPHVVSPISDTTGADGASITLSVADHFDDIDSSILTYSAANLPPGLTIDPATGVISGTIAGNASQTNNGVYTVVVTATDAAGLSVDTVFTFTVTNPAPITVDDAITIDEDSSVTIPVLANDSDPDGDPLSVIAASAPNGTATINPDGTISYTPNANFNGTDTISYTVSDGNGGTSTATITVTVNPVNDAPIVNDDTATTPNDRPITIPVLANDSDVEGDPLSVTGATTNDGSVVVNPDGTITFTPLFGFVGTATVTYTVSDGQGGVTTGTLRITVTDGDAVSDIETMLRFGHVDVPTPDPYREALAFDRNFILAPPVVLDAVNGINTLNGTLDLAEVDGVILATANHIARLNGIGDFTADGHPISEEVARIAVRNTLQAGAPGLFDRHAIDFSHYAGSSLNLVANDNGMSFETLMRGETIYLEIRDIAAPGAETTVRFELRGPDGTVPDWIQFDARGLAIIDPPAGSDAIPLTIRAVRSDGSYTETRILLRTHSGAIEITDRSQNERPQGETQAALPLDRVARYAADRANAEAAQLLRAFGS